MEYVKYSPTKTNAIINILYTILENKYVNKLFTHSKLQVANMFQRMPQQFEYLTKTSNQFNIQRNNYYLCA